VLTGLLQIIILIMEIQQLWSRVNCVQFTANKLLIFQYYNNM
jgi:hypothetical protein